MGTVLASSRHQYEQYGGVSYLLALCFMESDPGPFILCNSAPLHSIDDSGAPDVATRHVSPLIRQSPQMFPVRLQARDVPHRVGASRWSNQNSTLCCLGRPLVQLLKQGANQAHVGGIKCVAHRVSLRPFSLGMSQLRTLAWLLAAIAGGASAFIGPGADLPIVNRDIAPDGYLRL
jgi:hypothetical protein